MYMIVDVILMELKINGFLEISLKENGYHSALDIERTIHAFIANL